jgi:hypothetical protein
MALLRVIVVFSKIILLTARLWQESMRRKAERENSKAVDDAIATKDQRELEARIGNDSSGEPSPISRGVRGRPASKDD